MCFFFFLFEIVGFKRVVFVMGFEWGCCLFFSFSFVYFVLSIGIVLVLVVVGRVSILGFVLTDWGVVFNLGEVFFVFFGRGFEVELFLVFLVF